MYFLGRPLSFMYGIMYFAEGLIYIVGHAMYFVHDIMYFMGCNLVFKVLIQKTAVVGTTTAESLFLLLLWSYEIEF